MENNLEHVKHPEKYPLITVADRWLFLACFVLGTLGLLTIKSLSTSQFLATAFPVVIMLGYAVYVFRYCLHDQHAGDGVYYLGFLFTLISIAISLYQMNDGVNQVTEIISNFGIALATTIVGLALRVFIAQLQAGTQDIAQRVREDLNEVAKRLTHELFDIVDQFKHLRTSVTDEVNGLSHGVSESLSQLQSQLAEGAASLRKAINRLSDLMEKSAQNVHTSSLSAAESINHLVTSTNDFGQILDKSSQAADHFNTQIADFPRIQDVMNQLFMRVESLATATEQTSSSLSEILREAGNIQGEIKEQMGFIGKYRESIESDALNAQAAYQKLLDSMVNLANGIVEKLDEKGIRR